ncbi:MAG: hypothetical protein ABIJ00_01245 [Candidatus Eisenbacteria bacterium]
MARVVFILGAGASEDIGAPLISDFLDKAEDLKRGDKLSVEDRGSFENVFESLGRLRGIDSKCLINLDNIEEVFNTIEMGQIIGHLGELDGEQIDGLAGAIRRLIVCTLEKSIQFEWEGNTIIPVGTYVDFVRLLGELKTRGSAWSSAVITFNYDIAIDFAMDRAGLGIDYGFKNGTRAGGMPVLKLHGSVNWGLCDNCGELDAVKVGDHAYKQGVYVGPNPLGDSKCCMSVSSSLRGLVHKRCGKELDGQPFIVPPTLNKAQHHARISPVWKRAAEELADAEYVYVIGYSMPEADNFFRYLLAVGLFSSTRLRKFKVLDPDERLAERYKSILGQSTKRRFDSAPVKFQEAMPIIEDDLGLYDEGPGIAVWNTSDE